MPWGTVVYGGRFPIIPYRSAPLRIHKSKKKPKSCNRAHFMCADAAFCFPIFAPKKPVFHQIVRKKPVQRLGVAPVPFFQKSVFHIAFCPMCVYRAMDNPRNGRYHISHPAYKRTTDRKRHRNIGRKEPQYEESLRHEKSASYRTVEVSFRVFDCAADSQTKEAIERMRRALASARLTEWRT